MSKTLIKEGVTPEATEAKSHEFMCEKCGCIWQDNAPNGTYSLSFITSECMHCGATSFVTTEFQEKLEQCSELCKEIERQSARAVIERCKLFFAMN